MSAEFPPNTRRDKTADEPKKVERVVTSGEATRRKRGLGRQFKETFIGGDARGAAEYVAISVIVPAIKDMISEAFHSGIDRMIYGDQRPHRRVGGTPPGYGSVNYTPYNRMGAPAPPQGAPARPQQGGSRMLSRAARTRHDFGEIIIPTRPEAEEVLDRMYELLSKYGTVSVADLYEMTGIQSAHTDYKWGWGDLRGSRVRPLRAGGYLLDLPEPQSFD